LCPDLKWGIFYDMAARNIQDLLLAPELSFEQVSNLLRPYRFEDFKKADANLQSIADEPSVRERLADILDPFLTSLSESADPDQGLNHFERFTRAAFSKASLLSYLQSFPGLIPPVMKVFGGSPFLSEILIRNPEYFYLVFDPSVLAKGRKRSEMLREISAAARRVKTKEEQTDLLRILKRKEILRIGVRDLLREASVEETLTELSDLAEGLIRAAYLICEKEMRRKHGAPRGPKTKSRSKGKKTSRPGFTVVAMGKLGGRELNFSSDVDLIYLYTSSAGRTSGASGARESRISNVEYFRRLAQEITTALNVRSEQGYVYRVDLRLRPEGEMGLIAQPLQGYRRYYASRGETWERLALIKAWPMAGDLSLGKAFLKMVSPFVYGQAFGPPEFREVKGLKNRVDEKVAEEGQTAVHVKLGQGGIREIEFSVQSLQLAFGRKRAGLRGRNTLAALKKLRGAGLMSKEEALSLSRAYLFLRDVENKLQMVDDLQTHLFPTDPREIGRLAARLCYADQTTAPASTQLLRDYESHTSTVHSIFQRVFKPGLR
jgi:glutamate-ammonia-ligase adenylyltransferase